MVVAAARGAQPARPASLRRSARPYRELHVLRPAPDRVLVLESAGNLATTQEVLDRIRADLAGDGESLATVGHLHEAALYGGGWGAR
jgi:predicted proteasome-type protease